MFLICFNFFCPANFGFDLCGLIEKISQSHAVGAILDVLDLVPEELLLSFELQVPLRELLQLFLLLCPLGCQSSSSACAPFRICKRPAPPCLTLPLRTIRWMFRCVKWCKSKIGLSWRTCCWADQLDVNLNLVASAAMVVGWQEERIAHWRGQCVRVIGDVKRLGRRQMGRAVCQRV